MISQHCNWRTLEQWQRLNVPLSTPSNEACKMYDATVTQLAAFWDDPSVGGVATSMEKMLKADPDFVVGKSLNVALQLYSAKTTVRHDPDLKAAVDNVVKLAEKQTDLTPAEKNHAKAVQLMADGYLQEACMTWEDILADHPHDLAALKLAYLGYVYLGNSLELRNSPARVLAHWSPSDPLYGYVVSMYAFGLNETSLYDRAEREARKALEINRHNAWATHTVGHVYEMTGQPEKGIQFYGSTVKDWEVCTSLFCHNSWHTALYHVDKGEYEEALTIFDTKVKKMCLEHRDLFNIVDSASLLLRLELEGVSPVEQWKEIQEVTRSYVDDHCLVCNDLHLMMSCLWSEDKKSSQHLMDALEEFVRNGKGTAHDVHSKVGLKVCKAMAAYKEGDFAEATEIMYPVRHDVFATGGSNAQRDVFNLFLIASAIKSPQVEHHRLARSLLAERVAYKGNSPITDRLLAKVMALV